MMGIRSSQDEDGITMKGQAGVEFGGPSKAKTSLMHERGSGRAIRTKQSVGAFPWKRKLVVEIGAESYTVELSKKVSILRVMKFRFLTVGEGSYRCSRKENYYESCSGWLGIVCI